MRQKFTLRCEYINEDTGKREEINEASMEFPYEVGLMDSSGELLFSWFKDALTAMGYHRDNVEKFFNA